MRKFCKNEDECIKNIKILFYVLFYVDEIYRSIGFKPKNNSVKYFRKLTIEELNGLQLLKNFQTVIKNG